MAFWRMNDPFFDPFVGPDIWTMQDYVDRQLDRMFGAPRGEQQQRMIQGGQAGQEGQQGQVQKQGQQGQQGQVAQRDMFRNRMLAGRGFKVDVSETPQNYIVRADLPGVDKKDIKIEIDDANELLTIQAQKHEEKKEDSETRHVVERSWGSFVRSFRLPDNVNVDQCNTKYDNGVLELTFGKKPEEKKEPKRIEIK